MGRIRAARAGSTARGAGPPAPRLSGMREQRRSLARDGIERNLPGDARSNVIRCGTAPGFTSTGGIGLGTAESCSRVAGATPPRSVSMFTAKCCNPMFSTPVPCAGHSSRPVAKSSEPATNTRGPEAAVLPCRIHGLGTRSQLAGRCSRDPLEARESNGPRLCAQPVQDVGTEAHAAAGPLPKPLPWPPREDRLHPRRVLDNELELVADAGVGGDDQVELVSSLRPAVRCASLEWRSPVARSSGAAPAAEVPGEPGSTVWYWEPWSP